MVFDLPCVVQRSRNKDWWLCFLLFCASHQCWELVLGTWARLKGLRPALELRYWNSWRVLAWVSFPHPRQPLLSVAKEATLLLVDCQAWEHLYLHPPPLAGTWRLQNPTPPHCPHSTAVGVQMEKWCSLVFFLFCLLHKHLYSLISNLFPAPSGCCESAGEFGLQPEPSLVLSQLVQRHTGPSLPLARQTSPQSQQQAPSASASPAPQHTSTPAQAGPVMAPAGAKPLAPNAGLDPQGNSTTQQQRVQLKGQKRRIPPTSKVNR